MWFLVGFVVGFMVGFLVCTVLVVEMFERHGLAFEDGKIVELDKGSD